MKTNLTLLNAERVIQDGLYINDSTPVFNLQGELYGYYDGLEKGFVKINNGKVRAVQISIAYFKVIQEVISTL